MKIHRPGTRNSGLLRRFAPRNDGITTKDIILGGSSVTDTFDFVVVGGGSGGCAVAGRLSEDPKTSVALLEAGGRGDNWVVTTPGAMMLMVSGKVNNWAFDTVPQAGPQRPYRLSAARQGARRLVRDQRHGLYPRPSKRLRSMGRARQRRLVVRRCAALLQALGGQCRTRTANITARAVRSMSTNCAPENPVQETFLQAAREAQFRIREDFNAEDQEGLGPIRSRRRTANAGARRAAICIRTWRRAPICASRPRRRPPASCSRASARSASNTGRARRLRQIRARREVILSSGAFQTPQLLMLSGVGDSAALAKHGIATRASSARRRTKPAGPSGFRLRLTCPTVRISPACRSAASARMLRAIGQYRRERRGPMTSNFAECGGFLKTRPDLDVPDIQLHFGMAMVDDHGRKRRWGSGFSCHVCLLRPKSRGSVSLAQRRSDRRHP